MAAHGSKLMPTAGRTSTWLHTAAMCCAKLVHAPAAVMWASVQHPQTWEQQTKQ
jgi:hypothetical protein